VNFARGSDEFRRACGLFVEPYHRDQIVVRRPGEEYIISLLNKYRAAWRWCDSGRAMMAL
jgi:hypothetical protein